MGIKKVLEGIQTAIDAEKEAIIKSGLSTEEYEEMRREEAGLPRRSTWVSQGSEAPKIEKTDPFIYWRNRSRDPRESSDLKESVEIENSTSHEVDISTLSAILKAFKKQMHDEYYSEKYADYFSLKNVYRITLKNGNPPGSIDFEVYAKRFSAHVLNNLFGEKILTIFKIDPKGRIILP